MRLFAVVGPSGAGKDTLMAAAAHRPGVALVRRVITRPAEAGGEDFEGVTPEAFAARKARGAFALDWEAHGLRYGIPHDQLRGGDVIFNGSRAALPAALFGLGGVLHRYKPEGDSTAIAICCLCSLVVHPVTTYGLGLLFQLPAAPMRSAVITASMAPGVNAYLFASIYNSAKRVAASTVLVSTALSILTIWFWISVLP